MNNVKRLMVVLVMVLAVMGASITMLEVNTLTVHAASTQLNKKNLTLKTGQSQVLKLKNSNKKAKWSSSNSKVAQVNKRGKVIAKTAGTTRITAKVGKRKYTCKVKVNFEDTMLTVGKATKLNLEGVSASRVIWCSSNRSVATVKRGKIKAKGKGIAKLSAKVGKSTFTTNITVKERKEKKPARLKKVSWQSYFKIDYMKDTADGIIIKATNISSKTIRNVLADIYYIDAKGKKIYGNYIDYIEGIGANESFYMTFAHPIGKKYVRWGFNFKVNDVYINCESKNTCLSLENKWFNYNGSIYKSGVRVRNNSYYALDFELIAIYKYKGNIVGFSNSFMQFVDCYSVIDCNLEGSCASKYDEVEIVINNCASYF
ncbi:Ig-like domain-containing protein [Anaerosacchariphilus polymeriproducens]|uniref:BIG2 domain-containing protein n=1 Tax=Anaerosacchariphilus polymeriproducens TaxID=1812858 RepID=A0A371AQQ9_9FIRM|nr:Ig-like domain-containing protein [Anaerosacchariphilus polymeriproducens]RDU21800.1 hypothetical protein DWV06_17595 [Anaerosacchariphilus polymeriproducens]